MLPRKEVAALVMPRYHGRHRSVVNPAVRRVFFRHALVVKTNAVRLDIDTILQLWLCTGAVPVLETVRSAPIVSRGTIHEFFRMVDVSFVTIFSVSRRQITSCPL